MRCAVCGAALSPASPVSVPRGGGAGSAAPGAGGGEVARRQGEEAASTTSSISALRVSPRGARMEGPLLFVCLSACFSLQPSLLLPRCWDPH